MLMLLQLLALILTAPLKPLAAENGWISTCQAIGCWGAAMICREVIRHTAEGTQVTSCYFPR